MDLLITLIVIVIVLGLVYWLVSLIPLPEPFGSIVKVLFILLALVIVLSAFGILPGGHVARLRLG